MFLFENNDFSVGAAVTAAAAANVAVVVIILHSVFWWIIRKSFVFVSFRCIVDSISFCICVVLDFILFISVCTCVMDWLVRYTCSIHIHNHNNEKKKKTFYIFHTICFFLLQTIYDFVYYYYYYLGQCKVSFFCYFSCEPFDFGHRNKKYKHNNNHDHQMPYVCCLCSTHAHFQISNIMICATTSLRGMFSVWWSVFLVKQIFFSSIQTPKEKEKKECAIHRCLVLQHYSCINVILNAINITVNRTPWLTSLWLFQWLREWATAHNRPHTKVNSFAVFNILCETRGHRHTHTHSTILWFLNWHTKWAQNDQKHENAQVPK